MLRQIRVAVAAALLLSCVNGLSSQLTKLPEGNYQLTCSLCSMSNNILSCDCQDSQGFFQKTRLSVPENCAYIENINANLSCTHHYVYHDIMTTLIPDHAEALQRCPNVCANAHSEWSGPWTNKEGYYAVCRCKFVV